MATGEMRDGTWISERRIRAVARAAIASHWGASLVALEALPTAPPGWRGAGGHVTTTNACTIQESGGWVGQLNIPALIP